MTRTHVREEDNDHDTNAAVPMSWIGLTAPFVVVFAAVLAFGTRAPGQIAAAFLLLLVPLGVLAIRRSQRRSAGWQPPAP